MTLTLAAPVSAPIADDDVESRRRISSRTWDRIGFGVLLVATAVMYLWNITVNEMGNQFYAGAAQAGSKNWEALLFGSLDSNNFIIVDKPPVSQWVGKHHEKCPRNALHASRKDARETVILVRHGKWVVDVVSRRDHREVRHGVCEGLEGG
jgi:hypothetical protein